MTKTLYTLTVFELNEGELITNVFDSFEEAFQGINDLGIFDREIKNQKQLDKILDKRAEEGEDALWVQIKGHEVHF